MSIGGDANIANLNPIRYRGYYYDTETGFYYLNSRYYDPEICRFINADGYVSTGQGLLGNNMFAYCLNNSVVNEDSSGSIPMQCKIYSEGGGTASVTSSRQKQNNGFFGAGITTVVQTQITRNNDFSLIEMVTVTSGSYSTKTIYEAGSSSNPVSVYARGRADNWIVSSAGAKINVGDFTLNISFGLDNIGITGYVKNTIETNSFGVKANFSEFKIGFEGSTIIEESGKYMTKYQNASLSGWSIIAVVAFVQTGQWYSSSALLQAGS